MLKRVESITGKVGKPPGIIEYIGNYPSHKGSIIYRSYDNDSFEEVKDSSLSKISIIPDRVNWIQFCGLSDIEVASKLPTLVDAHSMLIEDILNTNHLPKYESTDNYVLVMLKAFVKNSNGELEKNSVCLLLGRDIVIDMHDFSHEFLDAKVERIKQGKGRARSKKADYLFYVLLDAYLDTYYLKFDETREAILELEDTMLKEAHKNYIEEIHQLKNELSELRKIVFPLNEALQQLRDEEPDLIKEENLVFINDLKDHMKQFTEYYANYNEMIKSLLDINNSNQNNSINQVMKVLTIIATIFIPLTFIAGIYGMNFENIPELKTENGYYIILGSMLIIALVMLGFMKKKKWF